MKFKDIDFMNFILNESHENKIKTMLYNFCNVAVYVSNIYNMAVYMYYMCIINKLFNQTIHFN